MRTVIVKQSIWMAALVLLLPSFLHGEVTLHGIFSDHMVLQRNQPVKVWGWAEKGEKIAVTLDGQTVRTRAGKDGEWKVSLDPPGVGGPYEMRVQGKNKVLIKDILVGDVWVCSGQSNMEWTVANADNAEEEIGMAEHPGIRLFTLPHAVSLEPEENVPGGEWQVCSPETAGEFSAVGYYFGRYIHREAGVPVGLISTNWGGTNVETWISREMAMNDPEMAAALNGAGKMDLEEMQRQAEEVRQAMLASLGELGSGMEGGRPVWADPQVDEGPWREMYVPGLWEEQGLPGIDGVVWFRRTITLTAEQATEAAMLHLGAIDDSDQTWINGIEAGETLNKYSDKRIYRIRPDIMKPGDNIIAVRVEDTGGGGGFWGDPGEMRLRTVNGDIPLSGIWKYRVSSEGFKAGAQSAIHPNELPTLLYNAMIHPLTDFPVQGAIWYQGESNTHNAQKYRERFPDMIMDWRNGWGNPDMGFYFVQLANYMQPVMEPGESAWAELREAQTMALELPETGMAVAIDLGEADDIHPRNKQDVGKRLGLAALHDIYGKDVVYSGPVFRSMETEGHTAIIEMDPMAEGLLVRDRYGYVKGFAVAGEDRTFHWAKGHVEGNRVYLSSSEVDRPVAVRYAWADNPDDANLYNTAGLPAGPFRTDDWPVSGNDYAN